MLTAAVIHLEAAQNGRLSNSAGRSVHGFWFHHWKQADQEMADQLHQENQPRPYTLSPLMDLPRPDKQRQITVREGTQTWFRVTSLTAALSAALTERWLATLDTGLEISIGQDTSGHRSQSSEMRWRISGISLSPEEHPWAGQISYKELAASKLFNAYPATRWRLDFATPTAFHSSAGHFPFPLPDSLVSSWMRRWQALAPISMPDDLPDQVHQSLVINAYKLQTQAVREGKRLTVGCTGWMSLRALKMRPAYRAALDVLTAFAFFCGSGHRTSQGMGVTRVFET